MTNEQQQVREWMQVFGQETPEKPTIPDLATRKLRAKLILEEALETIAALGIQIEFINSAGRELSYVPELDKEFTLHEWSDGNLKEIADGCEDLKVVTEGTLVACGLVSKVIRNLPVFDGEGGHYRQDQEIDIDPFFNEVMRSNFSKLWTTEEVNTPDSYPKDYEVTQIKGAHPMDVKERIYLVEDKDGKAVKSPSYSPANLQPIIDSML